ncbi:MAG: alpha/beta fold hydrolase [Microscillaceae bacterium]|nr:alpha/beta fold hydrolase [Microscillaceae bacterium]
MKHKLFLQFFQKSRFYGLGLLILLSACSQDKETPIPEGQFLKTAERIAQYSSKNDLDNYLKTRQSSAFDPTILTLFSQMGVKVYRVVYKTKNVDGASIEASGLVIVPFEIEGALPLISVQHGTITSEVDAPSNYNRSTEGTIFGPFISSLNYVTVVPDYIGYGASKTFPHPYEHAASLGSSCLDLLRAARELCGSLNITLNGQLFLTGYSEGGYATMALHQYIEQQFAAEFVVTASAPGAGAYHKTAFAEYIAAADENLFFLNSYLWVLETYNWVYGLNRPWGFYLNEPYATNVATQGVFTDNIDYNPQNLFTQELRNVLINRSDTALINTFANNDLHDWLPNAPIRLFHGTEDDFVPFFNSQNALDAMTGRGATQVTLSPIEGGDHETSLDDFVVGVLDFFEPLRQ